MTFTRQRKITLSSSPITHTAVLKSCWTCNEGRGRGYLYKYSSCIIMFIDSSLCCRLVSSINAVFFLSLKVKNQSSRTISPKDKQKANDLGIHQQPFWIPKTSQTKTTCWYQETNKRKKAVREIGSQDNKAALLQPCCKIVSCSCATESRSKEEKSWGNIYTEVQDLEGLYIVPASQQIFLFLGKVKEKLQRADSLLIWRAEVFSQ